MSKIFTTIAFLLYFASLSISQTLRAYEKKASESFEEMDYSAALAYNQILLEIDDQRVDARFKSAEAARHIRAFKVAELNYEMIPDSMRTGEYALTDFGLAMTKKSLGKYDEAVDYFTKYINANKGQQNEFLSRARAELETCEWALEQINDPIGYEITHLDSTVNTDYSDFAPFKYGDDLYFTSLVKNDDGDSYTKLFKYTGKEKMPIFYDNPKEPPVSSANFAISDDGQTMYYTQCKTNEDTGERQCDIYFRKKAFDGDWGEATILPEPVNMPGYTTTQPALGKDEDGNELLFFASNRPGGKGKMDIWVSKMGNGVFLEPENLSVNTSDDEVTPYFYTPSQVLFFSSEGHKGFGGLDIFRSVKNGSNYEQPVNMGFPLNSGYDDLYYSFNGSGGEAFLASNRGGTMCATPGRDCVCNDIYRVNVKIDLKALVFNAVDSSDLQGVLLELVDLETGKIDTFYLNELGNDFYLPLDFEKKYELRASKDGYDMASLTLDTKGVYYSKTFDEKLYLSPQINLVVEVFDAFTDKPVSGAKIQLMSLPAKTDTFIVNKDGNKFEFPLMYGLDYSFTGSKMGFAEVTNQLTTKGIKEPKTIYKKIYFAAFDYLPFAVYFDNDIPDRRSRRVTTNVSYEDTYQRYMNLRQKFITERTRGLSSAEKEEKVAELNDFFDNYVKAGHDRLVKFIHSVHGYLQQGEPIEVVVEGYASPLAGKDYNVNLTKRRISSIINLFENYNSNMLKPYLDSGQLTVVQEPNGEEKAPTGISDSGKNRKLSVYSVEASKERRVRILDVRWKKKLNSLYEQLMKNKLIGQY